MKRSASAVWKGDLKGGGGTVSTESKALDAQPYSFDARFEQAQGTNPEELIGAAHAGCFSMALSMILGEAGLKPERIDTRADVTLNTDNLSISSIHLSVRAKVPDASKEQLEKCANDAKGGCPVSKLFNAEITMDAELVE